MKVLGFVPSKLNSERLPRKNVLPLAGRPLVNWALSTLAKSLAEQTIVYAADDEILSYIEPELPFRFVQRPRSLDSSTAQVEDFVSAFLEDVQCDVVVLLHITAPFISVATVDACIEAVTSGRHESAFAALELQRFAWFRNKPLNYDLNGPTPRTQDLEPVLVEQSGLYVFTRELFERSRRRISEDPYIHRVDWIEGHDIDTPEEFKLAAWLATFRAPG